MKTHCCVVCDRAIKPAGLVTHLKAKHPELLARPGSPAWRKIKACPANLWPCRICGEHLGSSADWAAHYQAVHEALPLTSATPASDLAQVNFCPCCRLSLIPVRVALEEQVNDRIPLSLTGCPRCGLDLEAVEQALSFIAAHTTH